MRDIVATIQSDQYRLITRGARRRARRPGRAGHRQDRGRAAPRVVAPLHAPRAAARACSSSARTRRSWTTSRTCCRRSARRRSSSARSPSCSTASRSTREDAADVARLKADPRLAEVVQRAVELAGAAGAGGARALRSTASSSRAGAPGRASCSTRRSSPASPLTQARERFRMAVLRRFYERYGELLGALALRSFDEVERALQRERLPRRSSSTGAGAAAAGQARRAAADLAGRARRGADGHPRRGRAEAAAARPAARAPSSVERARPAARSTWRARSSTAPPRAYGHVIVDEAQDLSPMQLPRCRGARVDGSLTILGDVAQATARSSTGAGRSSSRSCPTAAEVDDRGAAPRLSRAGRDHGVRAAAARPDRARRRAAARVPQGGDPPRLVGSPPDELLGVAIREAARSPSWTGCSP